MTKCLFPGSFDPPTNGHVNLIKRLSALYDEVIVCVMDNPAKRNLFAADVRVQLIIEATREISHVSAYLGHGFTVDMAKKHGATVLARGVRTVMDYEYETQLALTNRYLAPDIETVFLPASPELLQVSSSAVRDIHHFGGDVSGLVPENVKIALDLLKA